MSDVWACLYKCLDPNFLDILVCISECKVLKMGQADPLEPSLPIEMSTVHLKSQQRVLVIPEHILKIDIREEMSVNQFLEVWELADGLDHFYILPVLLCFQGCEHLKVLLEQYVDLSAQLSHGQHFGQVQELEYLQTDLIVMLEYGALEGSLHALDYAFVFDLGHEFADCQALKFRQEPCTCQFVVDITGSYSSW